MDVAGDAITDEIGEPIEEAHTLHFQLVQLIVIEDGVRVTGNGVRPSSIAATAVGAMASDNAMVKVRISVATVDKPSLA